MDGEDFLAAVLIDGPCRARIAASGMRFIHRICVDIVMSRVVIAVEGEIRLIKRIDSAPKTADHHRLSFALLVNV